jgi:ADP-heptose:LPS heptosyltransferase
MVTAIKKQKKILVIKLSALGDFIQALGAMAAIRKHHKNDHITLLTTRPFLDIAEDSGYFDKIWLDTRPKLFDPGSWLRLRKTLLQGKFDRVYDLQNNDRTSIYFRLFPRSKRPEWVGTARGASHRNKSNERTASHAIDGHRQTLALAGIEDVQIDDLSWMHSDTERFGITKPYALLVPGSAPERPEKRWPGSYYAELANIMCREKITPVLLGTASEEKTAEKINSMCELAVNLCGETSIYDIAVLARNAELAVGNDTGPMHIVAATGCPCLTLFSKYSDPVKHGPRGRNSVYLKKDELENLRVEEVLNKLHEIYQNFKQMPCAHPAMINVM